MDASTVGEPRAGQAILNREPMEEGAPEVTELYCEAIEPGLRYRLLLRMRQEFESGVRDPDLLYLGGRYAASLSMEQEACRFLDELSTLFQDGDRKSLAYFPLGLLYLRVLPVGDRRDAVVRDLESIATAFPVLHRGLQAAIGSPEQVAPGAARVIDALEQDSASIRQLSRAASDAYVAGDLPTARLALEDLLLRDGDQTDVLWNLLIVTGEQEHVEAYERYWRRYVKLHLWRVMRGDTAWAAREELVRFYLQVATATDRVLGASALKSGEPLRTPGLLPRWLEAHVALIWLGSSIAATRDQQTHLGADDVRLGRLGCLSLMELWFRAFYPEFDAYLDLGENPLPAGSAPPGRLAPRLSFDPSLKVLTRFAEWSRVQFGLENDKDAHAEAVTALAESVARIPWQPYVKEMEVAFRGPETQFPPFRQTMQEACSLPLRFRLQRFLEAEDWTGLLSFYGDADVQSALTAVLRLFVALAYCKVGQETKALDLSVATLVDLRGDDLHEDSQARVLWKNVVQANLQAGMKGPAEQRAQRIADLKARLSRASRTPSTRPLIESAEAEIDEALTHVRLQEQVERAIESSKRYVEQHDFEKARRVIASLPGTPREVAELKTNFLEQINQAAEQYGLRTRIDAAIAQSKKLVEKGRFSEAKQEFRRLPDAPAELKELKASLIRQIEEAERRSGLHKQLEKAIEESKKLVEAGKFDEARKVIRQLPDADNEVKKLKSQFLDQIGQAAERAAFHKQIEQTIAETKKLVEREKFDDARKTVRRLPDSEDELKKLKKQLLAQIDDAERSAAQHKKIQNAIDEAKKLVEGGKFKDARRAIQKLSDDGDEIRELKKKFLEQIDEVERSQRAVQEENTKLMSHLSSRRVDLSKIPELARANNIDVSNPYALNALLKAVKEQVG